MLSATQMRKTEVKTDKPIYLGFLTLDWSNNNNKKKKNAQILVSLYKWKV